MECSRRHQPQALLGSQRGLLDGPAQGLQCLSSPWVCVFSIKETWEAACRAVCGSRSPQLCVRCPSVLAARREQLCSARVPGSATQAGCGLVCFLNLGVLGRWDENSFSVSFSKKNETMQLILSQQHLVSTHSAITVCQLEF